MPKLMGQKAKIDGFNSSASKRFFFQVTNTTDIEKYLMRGFAHASPPCYKTEYLINKRKIIL